MRASLKAVLAASTVSGALVVAGPALAMPVDALISASVHSPEMRLPYVHASLLWSAPMRILALAAPEQSADGTFQVRDRETKRPKVCHRYVH